MKLLIASFSSFALRDGQKGKPCRFHNIWTSPTNPRFGVENTVVTKTLLMPKSEMGRNRLQTITYKGSQFLTLTIQQKRPVGDELKTFILKMAKRKRFWSRKNEIIQEAQDLHWKPLPEETEIQTTTTYDFRFGCQKRHSTRIFKK